MKPKAIPLLIIVLLAAPLTAVARGDNNLAVHQIKARTADAQTRKREVVVKLRPGTKILIGKKAYPFELIRGANLSGRVKEMREQDFTFSGTSARTGEVTAVIRYDDVLGITHSSGFKKVLKKVGEYSLGAAAMAIILPVYSLAALLGHPIEGC